MNFRKKQKSDEQGFQIAPMMDVIFLLLCFFIASQIFSQWETEISIKLPTSQTGEMPGRLQGEVIINILQNGGTVVNGRELDEAGLMRLLERIVVLFDEQAVVIRADQTTAYEHVIGVLDLCRLADVWNISFATTFEGEE